jgi:hypothetical protein
MGSMWLNLLEWDSVMLGALCDKAPKQPAPIRSRSGVPAALMD